MTSLAPAPNVRPAEWVVGGLRGFAQSVLSIVPAGFDAYVRVFHPAYLRPDVRVTWAEIAAANAKEAHAGMQLVALTGNPSQSATRQRVFEAPPRVGTLEPDLARALAVTLARYTTTPEHCHFAVWYGFGGLRDDVRVAPTFVVPHREYHLLTGPAEAAAENVGEWPSVQSPNIWWPEDRAWCVATEIDLNSTYVACSEACRDEVLALDLETLAIDPTTGIDYRSDQRNGL